MSDERQAQFVQSPAPKLTCALVTALSIDYITEDMQPETRLSFEAHLRNCQDCTAFLDTYRQTIRTTRALCYEDIPATLAGPHLAISARQHHPQGAD